MYSGYIANNSPNFRFNSPNYAYTDGWSAKRWDHFYADRTVREYSHLLKTFKFVDYEKYKNAFYITRIYWAFLASMQTDTYGDIPLSAYVQAKVVEGDVPYDTQEKAYDIIFRLLEQAVDSIVPVSYTHLDVYKRQPLFDESYYGQVIHEIREMTVMNMGNYAHGNQPIQHMIYLYNYAGEPWKAQYWLRQVMNRMYTPSLLYTSKLYRFRQRLQYF